MAGHFVNEAVVVDEVCCDRKFALVVGVASIERILFIEDMALAVRLL